MTDKLNKEKDTHQAKVDSKKEIRLTRLKRLEKKLKMVELQLKKEKLDKEVNPNGEIVQGEGYIVADRNSILEKLKNMDK